MLSPFTGYYGVTALVQLDADTRIMVVAQDEPALERAVNTILAGQGEYNPSRTQPCILINRDLFPNP